MIRTLYLDTSVISMHDDDRSPERRDMTREFWEKAAAGGLSMCISEITLEEVAATRGLSRRDQMLRRLEGLPVLRVDSSVRDLARLYLDRLILPASVPDDALHIALATRAKLDVIVSWNFKHFVNLRRKAAIHALHQALDLPAIAIVSPPEAVP